MKKLNKRLFATVASAALLSTVAFENSGLEVAIGKPEGHFSSWKQAWHAAPIDETDDEIHLMKSVTQSDLRYTEDSDSDEDDIEINLAKQAATAAAATQKIVENEKTSWSTSLWVKAKLLWTITVSVAKKFWFA